MFPILQIKSRLLLKGKKYSEMFFAELNNSINNSISKYSVQALINKHIAFSKHTKIPFPKSRNVCFSLLFTSNFHKVPINVSIFLPMSKVLAITLTRIHEIYLEKSLICWSINIKIANTISNRCEFTNRIKRINI